MMAKLRIACFAFVAALLGGCGGGGGSKANLKAGKVVWDSCTICHSTKEMQRGPMLEGREAWYVETQLNKFRKGWRGANPANRSEVLMASALEKLPDDAAVRNVAAYIESLPPLEHRKTVRGFDLERGQTLFRSCATCHGAKGEGIRQINAPSLAGLEDWYLIDQLRKFKSGARGAHPGDTTGMQMALSSKHLSPQDMKDVTAFIVRLKDPKPDQGDPQKP